MTKVEHCDEHIQTPREELLNAISHGLGLLMALASLPILVTIALRQGTVATVVGAVMFSSTMAVLYFASTAYHALPLRGPSAWNGEGSNDVTPAVR